jgi:3-dehydroquinate synthase
LNPASQTVRVELAERSYDILIGRQLLPAAAGQLCAHRQLSHVVLITDENVGFHAATVEKSLADEGVATKLLLVPPGEHSKSVAVADRLWNEVLAAGTDRQSVIVAVGGGVVGDLAGFIAATFARGIEFVQVPTTLLAQVDSSVGGKVGINLPAAKNMVGAFWQPQFVLIDTDVLSTLPDREFRAGLAEVVKYGVILDAEFFRFLEQNAAAINNREPSALAHTIARCCQLKADVVRADERETSGHRARLNYGHTFGHAIEAVSGYGRLLHGEAISIGMLCASRLAHSLSLIDAAAIERQRTLLTSFGLPTDMPELDHDEILAAMQHDKKVAHGKLRFILPDRIGNVKLASDVDTKLVRGALQD